jgi:DNA-binding transcriptional LysR family regulator
VRAARRLHVAQPSVSRQIHDLEREVGCQLLERLARGVRLTPAGEAFLMEARKTVENATRAIASARDAVDRERSNIIVATGRLSHYPNDVVHLLSQFRAAHPECEIRMHAYSDRAQQVGLREHTISAAIAWVSGAPSSDFAYARIRDYALQGVLLAASHPLAAQSYISLPQLRSSTRLHSPRSVAGDQFRLLRNALLIRGLEPARHRAVATDISSVCMNLASGDAFILANDKAARAFVANSNVVYRRFAEPAIPMWLTLFWRREEASFYVLELARLAAELTTQENAVA